ncbi:guanylate kinase [Dehalobacter sp. TeCB1]|uniref:guanylate kinase n=1 Tax=Dehalobacter sp. TeCB1 TaxID=1843715 RepID=UPI000839E601|nr:guanylate kinase [Dehalobacter sp. TeCB1]OCZ53810.1 guanylate kinase [Dehalobacter sp. TeCB1]
MPAEVTTLITQVLSNLALGIIALLGALISLYVRKGIKKLQAETQKINDEATRTVFDAALTRLNDVALKTVNAIEQTTKKDILKAVSDGTANRDQLKNLAFDAYEEIVATLEPEYRNLLEGSLGDAQTYIMNLIEEKLEEVKAKKVVIDLGNTSPEVTV